MTSLNRRQLLEVDECRREFLEMLPPKLRGRGSFYLALSNGRIPAIKIGRRYYIVRDKFEALLRGEVQPGAS